MLFEVTEQVYAFICAYFQEYHCAPSQREIAKACYMVQGSVPRHLDRLEKWGWITWQPGKARSIFLTDLNRCINKTWSNE